MRACFHDKADLRSTPPPVSRDTTRARAPATSTGSCTCSHASDFAGVGVARVHRQLPLLDITLTRLLDLALGHALSLVRLSIDGDEGAVDLDQSLDHGDNLALCLDEALL